MRGVADLEWKKKAYRIKRVRVKRGRQDRDPSASAVFRRWVTAKRSTQVTRVGRHGVKGGEGVSPAAPAPLK